MRGRDGLGQRDGQVEESPQRDTACPHLAAQGLPLHQFHGQERLAPGLLGGVERHDVRVLERGDRQGLTPEAGDPLRVAGDLGREDLQRDLAPELLADQVGALRGGVPELPGVGRGLGRSTGREGRGLTGESPAGDPRKHSRMSASPAQTRRICSSLARPSGANQLMSEPLG